jgi:FlgD Ig-like domain
MSTSRPDGRDRARRAGVAVAMLVLFIVAVGVFVLPFAFPTPPPIVTRFQATQLFSPNSDGRRDIARIGVRLSQASDVTLAIRRDGEDVAVLLDAIRKPRGFFTTSWDGRDSQGFPVPDGTYAITLRVRSGEKQFNTSRKVIVDTTAPRPASLTVVSATLAAAGPGQCRVSFTPADAGSVTLEARPFGGTAAVRTLGPRPIQADRELNWNWSGVGTTRAVPVPPGLYVIRASLRDAARNAVTRERTCWVGYIAGTARPARPATGDAVGVTLRATDGTALPGSTRIALVLQRRTGVPGVTFDDPLGVQVGPGRTGPAGRVTVTVPRGVNPAALWLVARRLDGSGVALVDLRGTG